MIHRAVPSAGGIGPGAWCLSKFSIGYVSTLKAFLAESTTPVVVIGAGRSGTTPLRAALHEHPDILMASGHSPMIPWLAKTAYHYFAGPNRSYYERNTALSAEELLSRLRDLCLDCVWNEEELFTVTRRKQNQLRSPEDHFGLQRWGTRAYPDQHSVLGLTSIFPGIAFIHIVRNGIEVIHSMSKYKAYRRLDFDKRCRLWAARILRDHFLGSRGDCFSIRFEDLLEHPSEVMSGVLSFLGLPPDEAPARFLSGCLVHPLDGPTIKANPLSVHKQRPPAFTRWTATERDSFRSICGRAMALLHYPIPF